MSEQDNPGGPGGGNPATPGTPAREATIAAGLVAEMVRSRLRPAAEVSVPVGRYLVLGPVGARAVAICLETCMVAPPVDQSGWSLLCDLLMQLKDMAGLDPKAPCAAPHFTRLEDNLKAAADLQFHTWPRPGSRWRHWKGGTYRVIISYPDEATHEPRVVYYSEDKGRVRGRTLTNWTETVVVKNTEDGQGRGAITTAPRFVEIREDGGNADTEHTDLGSR